MTRWVLPIALGAALTVGCASRGRQVADPDDPPRNTAQFLPEFQAESEMECMGGGKRVGKRCAPAGEPDCPDDQRYVPGRGCVPDSDDEPDRNEVGQIVKDFYDNEGEFQTQYVIKRVIAMRIERLGPDRFNAHVHYRFECIRDSCCCGASGEDKRVFRLRRTGSGWRVTAMGDHMSAQM